jgi:hypothetical protein
LQRGEADSSQDARLQDMLLHSSDLSKFNVPTKARPTEFDELRFPYPAVIS